MSPIAGGPFSQTTIRFLMPHSEECKASAATMTFNSSREPRKRSSGPSKRGDGVSELRRPSIERGGR